MLKQVKTQWIDTNDKMVQYNYHKQFVDNGGACKLSLFLSPEPICYIRAQTKIMEDPA